MNLSAEGAAFGPGCRVQAGGAAFQMSRWAAASRRFHLTADPPEPPGGAAPGLDPGVLHVDLAMSGNAGSCELVTR
jgi:hypothetical protein